MKRIESIEALEAHYGVPSEASLVKVADHLTPGYRDWVRSARFVILSTVGEEGTDASPRGDDGPVVAIVDDRTLALPDWHGNNRIDSLRNIVRDPRLSLMFLVPGSNNVIRINGQGFVTADTDARAQFERGGKQPRTVVMIRVQEVYFQCARAFVRSALWAGIAPRKDLPTTGDILAEQSEGRVGGSEYDAAWAARASETLW